MNNEERRLVYRSSLSSSSSMYPCQRSCGDGEVICGKRRESAAKEGHTSAVSSASDMLLLVNIIMGNIILYNTIFFFSLNASPGPQISLHFQYLSFRKNCQFYHAKMKKQALSAVFFSHSSIVRLEVETNALPTSIVHLILCVPIVFGTP